MTLRDYFKRKQFDTSGFSICLNSGYLIRRAIRNFIIQNAHLIHGTTLDFGCGSKPYESLFSRTEKYIGVDIEKSGHDHKDSKIDIFYDGQTLPFPDSYFDSIIAIEVFEHLPNPEEILDEFKRILKPNGNIIITIPFMYPEHEMPTDYSRWTTVGLRNVLENLDYRILSLVKSNNSVEAIAQNVIDYFFNSVLVIRNNYLYPLKMPFILSLNVIAMIASHTLPKNHAYYSNLCVVFTKI